MGKREDRDGGPQGYQQLGRTAPFCSASGSQPGVSLPKHPETLAYESGASLPGTD